jgi:hypothetical protein
MKNRIQKATWEVVKSCTSLLNVQLTVKISLFLIILEREFFGMITYKIRRFFIQFILQHQLENLILLNEK